MPDVGKTDQDLGISVETGIAKLCHLQFPR